MTVALIIAFNLLAGSEYSVERPPALLAAEAARLAYERAHIRWRVVAHWDSPHSGEPEWYEMRVAPNGVAVVHLGTAEGATAYLQGEPLITGPRRWLLTDQESWYRVGDDPFPQLWREPRENTADDIRGIGGAPDANMVAVEDVFDARPEARGKYEYRETDDGGRIRVDRRPVGEQHPDRAWLIDPAQGFAVVECVKLTDGVPGRRTVSTYRQYGDAWFLERCEFRTHGDLIYYEYDVEHAEFDTPALPGHLAPEHIGVEPGMVVRLMSLSDGPRRPLIYGGDGEVLALEEAQRRWADGTLPESATLLRVRELARAVRQRESRAAPRAENGEEESDSQAPPTTMPAKPTTQPVDPWDVYTREFAERHRFDSSERRMAMAVLRRCQERRSRLLEARREDVAEAERRLAAAPDDSAARRTIELVRSQVDSIFERELKATLERIATAARAARTDETP